MAAFSPRKRLQDEVTCPVCLEFFTEPVILACGHNFCQACIVQCWRESPTVAACPQCRESAEPKDLRPNRQLANMVGIAKELSVPEKPAKQEAGAWARVCERHQEPLKLFCQEDEAPICVVCDRSKDHRAHTVVPLDEAAQEYQDQISSRLEILRKEREKILACKADTEKKSQGLLDETKAEKQKTVAEFRQLHQFLEEQEERLLAQMKEVEQEIETKTEKHLAKLSAELFSLEGIIQEMVEKRQQPAGEFLQDVRSTLQSFKKEPFENPVVFPLELKWRIWEFSDINPLLERVMKQFKDTLLSGLQLQKASITLDPDTAHPKLILSKDHKSVRLGDKERALPNNPKRFSAWSCVLGCKGFTAGRHFWEVTVGNERNWAVGVARKSVKRNMYVDFSPEEGFWALGKWDAGYWASSDPDYFPLLLNGELKRIRVFLNCAGERVAFFDADSATLLFDILSDSFSKETFLPFLWVSEKGPLTLSL
ncbi:E3 ubiquitin-protein ligase TRIM7-like isoform X2 [Hemicordylus capensis]|uniref:E3 ubiquitin-protein ligase TRIM7-like isoform X2 n=1 Tax=Hemicordylus capensis TaxID=884348 RepID=UPI002303DFA7|nr:E3 ubiquitin-protein ligase TRIM7-like isoform X2 [Hemicordylus capensis]